MCIPHALNGASLCQGPVMVTMMVAVEEEEAEGVLGLQCCDVGHTQVPTPLSWFLGNIIAGNFL